MADGRERASAVRARRRVAVSSLTVTGAPHDNNLPGVPVSSAIVAQQVADVEINCARPWGKPQLKYGMTGKLRVGTNQEPSARCVRNRNARPRGYAGWLARMAPAA